VRDLDAKSAGRFSAEGNAQLLMGKIGVVSRGQTMFS
jgi:hypothetical protein